MTILGVLGEAARLGDAERTAVIDGVLAAAGSSIPVCVGVSHASTDRAVAFAREAEAAGAHSVMLAPPPLARATDAALRRHYLAVASAISIPVVVQDHPASSGVQMSVEFLLALAAEAPSCRVIKLEEEPTPPKAGRLVAGSPDVIVLGGLGGAMLLEELRRGSHGTMTGFGFPEVLVAVVRRWFAGDRDGRRGGLRPLRDADPVREPGAAQPADPQARLPAARRDRPRDASGRRACRPTRARSTTSTTCCAARGSTGTSRRARGRTSIDVVEVSTAVDYRAGDLDRHSRDA